MATMTPAQLAEVERRVQEEMAVIGEDLRKTKAERDRLLPFVIQKCPECGVVMGPMGDDAENPVTPLPAERGDS